MATINSAEEGIGMQVKKRLGHSRHSGEKIYGKFQYGNENPILGKAQYGYKTYGGAKYGEARCPYGIYQTRTRYGKQTNVREKFYIPSNPQTEAQQANRATYAAGIVAWQALTPSQKDVYNEKAKGKRMSGYNLFLQEYLLSH